MGTPAGFLQRLGHGGTPHPAPPPPGVTDSEAVRGHALAPSLPGPSAARRARVLARLAEPGRERERASSAWLSDKEPAPSIRPRPGRAPAAGALPGRAPRAAAPKPGSVAPLTGDEPSSVWFQVPGRFLWRSRELVS